MPPDKLHVTLFFLGNVERSRIPALEGVAQRISAPAFELDLDRVDYWRHNRIVWAGAPVCPPALAVLARDVSIALGDLGFMAEDRPYVPHVTLVRNAKGGPKRVVFPPIRWALTDWVLVESRQAQGRSTYEVISRRTLGV